MHMGPTIIGLVKLLRIERCVCNIIVLVLTLQRLTIFTDSSLNSLEAEEQSLTGTPRLHG